MVMRFDDYCDEKMKNSRFGEWASYEDYAALESRLAELEKDAARYRWLRDVPWISDEFGYDLRIAIQFQRNGLWDDMIDNAMSREA